MSGKWPTDRRTPFGAYYFEVEIEGTVYPFKSCGGLKIEQSVVEIEEGGFNFTTRKLPGRVKFSNIVLKMGFCGADSPLYTLKRRMMNDTPSGATTTNAPGWTSSVRFSGTITQKGPNGTEAKWGFRNGWLCKWEGPDLDASKNEVSIESIEIAHEGVYMLAPASSSSSSSTTSSSSSSSSSSSDGSSSDDGSDDGSGGGTE